VELVVERRGAAFRVGTAAARGERRAGQPRRTGDPRLDEAWKRLARDLGHEALHQDPRTVVARVHQASGCGAERNLSRRVDPGVERVARGRAEAGGVRQQIGDGEAGERGARGAREPPLEPVPPVELLLVHQEPRGDRRQQSPGSAEGKAGGVPEGVVDLRLAAVHHPHLALEAVVGRDPLEIGPQREEPVIAALDLL
jgi:hypothetical protein